MLQQAARARQFGGDFGLRFVFDGLELSYSLHGGERCNELINLHSELVASVAAIRVGEQCSCWDVCTEL